MDAGWVFDAVRQFDFDEAMGASGWLLPVSFAETTTAVTDDSLRAFCGRMSAARLEAGIQDFRLTNLHGASCSPTPGLLQLASD